MEAAANQSEGLRGQYVIGTRNVRTPKRQRPGGRSRDVVKLVTNKNAGKINKVTVPQKWLSEQVQDLREAQIPR